MADHEKETETPRPLVTLWAAPKHSKCPFQNRVELKLGEGGCVWLTGNSGAGKTTLSTFLAGLSDKTTLERLGIHADLSWSPSIPKSQRCGVLFQQTTLIDELTVAGNLAIALGAANESNVMSKIKNLLEAVGLDFERDADKRPSQLSGGMGRRASLALQLAQKKHVIVLDEPFTGLDERSANSVARELVRLRRNYGTALLLISHEPHLAKLVMGENTSTSEIIHLEAAITDDAGADAMTGKPTKPSLFGTTVLQRFLERLVDYVGWSFPLVLMTFTACGLAISMLSSDILRRINVTDQVLSIVEKEVKPLLKLLTGEEENTFTLMMVKMKVKGMLNTAVPKAKAALYAMGMAKLFVLEVGPLLTALLLCGRIGGSYAGKVATMQATSQNRLLRTLGIHPQLWTLVPSLVAALVASPILTVVGTSLSLCLGSVIGPNYGIGTTESYWEQVRESTFPQLRLKSFAPLWDVDSTTTVFQAISSPDLSTTYSDDLLQIFVEIATYPVFYHLIKSVVFMSIIMLTAEGCARVRTDLTPRHVPSVITSSVVTASLFIIIADWGFSQLLLQRA